MYLLEVKKVWMKYLMGYLEEYIMTYYKLLLELKNVLLKVVMTGLI